MSVLLNPLLGSLAFLLLDSSFISFFVSTGSICPEAKHLRISLYVVLCVCVCVCVCVTIKPDVV